jgi:hypothetical protein
MNIDQRAVLAGAGLLLALALPLAAAQEPTKDPLREAGKQKVEPAAPGGGQRAFIPAGLSASVRNEAGETLGTIRDHLIYRRNARVMHIVVEVQGEEPGQKRPVLVPYDSFHWNQERRDLLLDLSKEEIKALPTFDPPLLQDLEEGADAPEGKRPVDAGAPTKEPPKGQDQGGGKEGGQDKEGQDEGRYAGGMTGQEIMAKQKRILLSSEILHARVLARDKPYGSIGKLLLEPRNGRLAFALVDDSPGAKGGAESLVVPWQVLERDDQGRFVIPLSPDKLADAPRAAKGAERSLEEGLTLDAIYRFYGIQPPVEDLPPTRG